MSAPAPAAPGLPFGSAYRGAFAHFLRLALSPRSVGLGFDAAGRLRPSVRAAGAELACAGLPPAAAAAAVRDRLLAA